MRHSWSRSPTLVKELEGHRRLQRPRQRPPPAPAPIVTKRRPSSSGSPVLTISEFIWPVGETFRRSCGSEALLSAARDWHFLDLKSKTNSYCQQLYIAEKPTVANILNDQWVSLHLQSKREMRGIMADWLLLDSWSSSHCSS